jgi:hypothetical protein
MVDPVWMRGVLKTSLSQKKYKILRISNQHFATVIALNVEYEVLPFGL